MRNEQEARNPLLKQTAVKDGGNTIVTIDVLCFHLLRGEVLDLPDRPRRAILKCDPVQPLRHVDCALTSHNVRGLDSLRPVCHSFCLNELDILPPQKLMVELVMYFVRAGRSLGVSRFFVVGLEYTYSVCDRSNEPFKL